MAGTDHPGETQDAARERRLQGLLARLPGQVQGWVASLRRPQARWVRIPAAVLLLLGGIGGVLPILGFWMLPLGVALLSEDVPLLHRLVGRLLAWVEHRHPGWLARPAGDPAPPA